jgi:hypothetical protein
MTRNPQDKEPGQPVDRAADRLREFELQRGLEPDVPSEAGDDPGPSDPDPEQPPTEEA